MYKGDALGGLYDAQTTIQREIDQMAGQVGKVAGPGAPEALQKRIADLKQTQQNLDKVITLGFDGKEKGAFWKEKHADEVEAEKIRHDKAQEEIAEDKIKQMAASNDPRDAEQLGEFLAMGQMDPSQLSKRAKNYNAALIAANTYSMQRFGVPFDIEQAGIDYKYAQQKGTKDTLNYLNSLTGFDNKGGNLAQLVAQSNSIKRTEFPPLNDIAAWTKMKTGDPEMAAYLTTVTEVADQVAKILQGGGASGTSDAKLRQAAELFQKGFTKDQIIAIAGDLRGLLANRKTEMIGKNRYLAKEYGNGWSPSTGAQSTPAATTPAATPAQKPKPANATKTVTWNGVDYYTDDKGTNLGPVK
jgi:hypothetical protein